MKPCPFCFGPTRDIQVEDDRMVGCDNPYCEAGAAEMYPESWNTRPIEAELIEALEDIRFRLSTRDTNDLLIIICRGIAERAILEHKEQS